MRRDQRCYQFLDWQLDILLRSDLKKGVVVNSCFGQRMEKAREVQEQEDERKGGERDLPVCLRGLKSSLRARTHPDRINQIIESGGLEMHAE
jgi:hypothetical protein